MVSDNKIEEEKVEEDSILVDTRLSEGVGRGRCGQGGA